MASLGDPDVVGVLFQGHGTCQVVGYLQFIALVPVVFQLAPCQPLLLHLHLPLHLLQPLLNLQLLHLPQPLLNLQPLTLPQPLLNLQPLTLPQPLLNLQPLTLPQPLLNLQLLILQNPLHLTQAHLLHLSQSLRLLHLSQMMVVWALVRTLLLLARSH